MVPALRTWAVGKERRRRGCTLARGPRCPTTRLGPGSLPRCFFQGLSLGLFLLCQVYFFCSASACSPSGLEPCSAPCGSRTARASGLGVMGAGMSVFLHPSVLASGPLGRTPADAAPPPQAGAGT